MKCARSGCEKEIKHRIYGWYCEDCQTAGRLSSKLIRKWTSIHSGTSERRKDDRIIRKEIEEP
jgi:hypothetical protein